MALLEGQYPLEGVLVLLGICRMSPMCACAGFKIWHPLALRNLLLLCCIAATAELHAEQLYCSRALQPLPCCLQC